MYLIVLFIIIFKIIVRTGKAAKGDSFKKSHSVAGSTAMRQKRFSGASSLLFYYCCRSSFSRCLRCREV